MEPGRTFQKLTIHKFSSDIREASQVTEETLRAPGNGEILVKNHFAGVNATDMNIITGRSKIFANALPLDVGLEVPEGVFGLNKLLQPVYFLTGPRRY